MKQGLCPDMPMLVNDWLSSTTITLMTAEEEGGYFRLLCHAWNEPDCCLPDDDSALASLSRLAKSWSEGSGTKIRACFEADTARPGFIFNSKQRAIRAKQAERMAAAAAKCDQMRAAKAAKSKTCKPHSYKERPKKLLKHTSATDLTKGSSSPVTRLPSPSKKSASAEGSEANRPTEHREVIEAWSEFYRRSFGADYDFGGGRDGKAIKCLLKSGLTAADIVHLAEQARRHCSAYLARQATTIKGLHCRLNEIRAELASPAKRNGGAADLLPTKPTPSQDNLLSEMERRFLENQGARP